MYAISQCCITYKSTTSKLIPEVPKVYLNKPRRLGVLPARMSTDAASEGKSELDFDLDGDARVSMQSSSSRTRLHELGLITRERDGEAAGEGGGARSPDDQRL